MTISAKYPGVCNKCGGAISPGQQIEWAKGAGATHSACGGTTTAPAAAGSPSRPRYRRAWRPCGYPGCSPAWCDECDGEGYVPGR